MVSVDTNIIVCLLVNDDVTQQLKTVHLLQHIQEQGKLALITHVVLAEVSWVLESAYHYSRQQIAMALTELIDTTPFYVSERSVIKFAIKNYEEGSAGFADYLILGQSQALKATPLFTFDKKLGRHPLCERL